MTILIITVLLTILISFNCSLYEATLYSTQMATVEAEKVRSIGGSKLARRFLELKKNMAVPIASIVILNTVGQTGGATIAGMLAGEALEPSMVPLFSVAFALGILFIGEIMPKTLGAFHCRRLWPMVVWPITVINYAFYPIVLVARAFSNLFTRGEKMPSVTEQEILALVRLGAEEGEIRKRESRLVHNIIALEDKPIKEIMTPRTVMFSLDAGITIAEARKAAEEKGFTRIPIYEDHNENILGYIITHDLFSEKRSKSAEGTIKAIAKPISFVPESSNALALLTTSLQQRKHIFVAVDEYGGVAGLVTLEDLIETLLGDEIVDETDRAVDLQEIARKKRPQRPSE